jgi:phosphocarrier protein
MTVYRAPQEVDMPERRVTVASPVGLHARPAAVFVRTASNTGVGVTIARPGGAPVDARSMLAVMSLDVRGGEEVVLAAEGEGCDAALDELATLLATDLEAGSGSASGASAGSASGAGAGNAAAGDG